MRGHCTSAGGQRADWNEHIKDIVKGTFPPPSMHAMTGDQLELRFMCERPREKENIEQQGQ